MDLQPIRFVSYVNVESEINKDFIDKYFVPSLEKFIIPFWLKPIKDVKYYPIHCFTPFIIFEALNSFTENIVYVDSMSTIDKWPENLFRVPLRSDIGLHWSCNIFNTDEGNSEVSLNEKLIFIRNNPKMKAFVKEWLVKSSVAQKYNSINVLLSMIHEKIDGDFSMFVIPKQYSCETGKQIPTVTDTYHDRVISHYVEK